MNPRIWVQKWRELKESPVYRRERGGWGNPNPFYDTLSRFSPFVVIGAILLGICAGVGNPTLFANNSDLAVFWCFLCLPGMLLNALSLFGSFMAPALTAPAISMELNRGTWDILRVTPYSTRSIVTAKLLGALARLRIWPLLFALSLLHGLVTVCSVTFGDQSLALWGALLGAGTAVRPWLEVLFSALMGMAVSMRIRSATTALAASYAALVLFRLLNNSLVWLAVSSLTELDWIAIVLSGLGPTAVYGLAVFGLGTAVLRQADRLDYT